MPTNENEARFVVAFDGQAGDLTQVLNSLKSAFKTTVSELQATANKLELFGKAEKEGKELEAALTSARVKLREFQQQAGDLKSTGFPKAAEAMTESLQLMEKEVADLQVAFDKSAKTQAQYAEQLRRSGVDVKNYVAEQKRLEAALKEVARAQVEQQSKQALGLKTLRDVQPEINKINAAYQSLMASGKLSFSEQALAAARYKQSLTALTAQTGTFGEAFTTARSSLLAFTVAFVALGAVVGRAAADYRKFEQQVAAVGTIAEVSKARLDELAQGVRRLSQEIGLDAVEATKALYNIIGSGIPVPNSLDVLALSAKAAIAGLTDITSVTKLGVSILNSYGLQVSELERVYDILFRTVRDGIVSMEELAQHFGDLAPMAAGAKVPLVEAAAGMAVMTRNGISAAESVTALNRTIQDLSAPTPEAAKAMQELGIEFKGLTGTIEQFATKQLTVGQLRQLIPDQRAVKGVQVLTANYQLLVKEVEEIGKQEATLQKAYARMADTPEQQVKRLQAAIHDLSISIGQFVTNATPFIKTLTETLNSFNALAPSTKNLVIELTAATVAFGALYALLSRLTIPLTLLSAAIFRLVPALGALAKGVTLATASMGAFKAAVAGFVGFELGKWLYENSAVVRIFGDSLGILAGRVDNVVTLIRDKFIAQLNGSKTASDAATAAFLRNRDTLDRMADAVESGATERLFQLQKRFEELTKKLAEASIAASNASSALTSSVSTIAATVGAVVQALERHITELETSLGRLADKLKQNVTDTQTLLTATLSNLKAEADARIAALSQARSEEIATANATTAIRKKLADDQLSALKKGNEAIRKAFEEEAAARIEIAKRTAGNVKQVEQQIAMERRALIQDSVNALRQLTSQLQAQEQQHLGQVRDIQLQRKQIILDTESAIREAARETMTAAQQYNDRRWEAEQLISRARKALTEGDLKTAEELTRRAQSLTAGLAKQVVEGEAIVVSAFKARTVATDLYKREEALLLEVLDRREKAEQEGAKAATEGLKTAREQLAEYNEELAKVTQTAAEGISLNITTNVDLVRQSIADLDRSIEERTRLLKINADIKLAQLEVERLQEEIKNAVTANVDLRTDNATKLLTKVAEDIKGLEGTKPEVSLKIDTALEQIGTVRTEAKKIENVHMEITTNVDAVKEEIKALDGMNTSSTHTVYIKRVEQNAAGGTVGLNLPGFAQGGSVFARPSWSRVPGSGRGDTVPAALQAGDFVVRRSSSERYGAGLMSRVVHFASGGAVGEQEEIRKLKVEAEQEFTEILGRAAGLPRAKWGQDVRDYVWRVLEIIRGSMDLEEIQNLMDRVLKYYAKFYPAIENARQFRVPLVMGWNVAGGGEPIQEPKKSPFPEGSLFSRKVGSGRGGFLNFAEGGSADTVPAMLEPGEYVVKRQSVAALMRRFGGGIMDDINRARVPAGLLSSMLASPRGFAEGGSVGPAPANVTTNTVGATMVNNFYLDGSDLLSEENVRRKVIPVLDKVAKRSK